MSSSLQDLVNNIPKDIFQYLSQESRRNELELVKKIIVFEKYDKEMLKKSYSSLK